MRGIAGERISEGFLSVIEFSSRAPVAATNGPHTFRGYEGILIHLLYAASGICQILAQYAGTKQPDRAILTTGGYLRDAIAALAQRFRQSGAVSAADDLQLQMAHC